MGRRGEAPLAAVLAALPDVLWFSHERSLAPLPEKRTRTPKVIVDPSAPAPKKARTFPKKPPYYGKCIDGAIQKASGKWINTGMFPGREFDDLDAYRAAKKQRAEQRAAYSDQNIRRRK